MSSDTQPSQEQALFGNNDQRTREAIYPFMCGNDEEWREIYGAMFARDLMFFNVTSAENYDYNQ